MAQGKGRGMERGMGRHVALCAASERVFANPASGKCSDGVGAGLALPGSEQLLGACIICKDGSYQQWNPHEGFCQHEPLNRP
ncbi:hypothetical protein M758_3G198700 [Ceratodon purpureus]|nr:hypothetical protein M758_3G198700 [Ceratodon purpureus]